MPTTSSSYRRVFVARSVRSGARRRGGGEVPDDGSPACLVLLPHMPSMLWRLRRALSDNRLGDRRRRSLGLARRPRSEERLDVGAVLAGRRPRAKNLLP